MTDEPLPPRTYPRGVPSWVDAAFPDPDAAADFYGGLFGWEFEERMPPGVPGSYRYARLDGELVGAIGSRSAAVGADARPAWTTYFATEDVHADSLRVTAAGGTADEPQAVGPGGSSGTFAICEDAVGTTFGLWQAAELLGAQYVNRPGGWVFSELRTADRDRAFAFYRDVFGWELMDLGTDANAMIRVPGYGDHLAATADPGIRERQFGAPDGFVDAIGAIGPAGLSNDPDGETTSRWFVSFSVADRDTAAARVRDLGGTVLATYETAWVRAVEIEDPQGARIALTQFAPRG
jgi:uncharacterized protein